MMQDAIKQFLLRLDQYSNTNEVVDLYEEFSLLSLDIIFRVGYGISLLENEDTEIEKLIATIRDGLSKY